MGFTTRSSFSRQPLSTLGKLTIAALLGSAILCGLLWSFIGADAIGLLIFALILLLGAGLSALGFRWTPLFGTLLGGSLLVAFFTRPYVIYHLSQPKEAFNFFVVILLILACAVVAFGAGIGATMQNYRQSERSAPRWLTSAMTGMVGVVVGAIFIAAISQPIVATGASSTNQEPTVHMGPGSFLQSSVIVPKGSRLLLVDDGAFPHILANGSWQNGTPRPGKESAAPTVNSLQVNGNSVEIGPFSTAGTYSIYCTIHQGMSLTIIVQ